MRVGVIGLGFMGAAHVAAIMADPQAELAAVVTRNPEARKGNLTGTGGNLTLKSRVFDFSKVSKYHHFRDLVADASIDAVTVCLPTDLHAQVTVAALSNKKHVLCEKPMALSARECDEMIGASHQAGRCLMIAQVLRFWPEYIALRDWVTSGRYGRIRQATFLRKCGLPNWSGWLPDGARSGGATLDLLIHDIDQMLLLFGLPDRVTAKRLGEDDALMASFIYPAGPEVRLQGGWFSPGMPFSMSFQVRADKGEIDFSSGGLYLSDMTGTRRKLEVEPADAYAAEVHYFLDCCRAGTEPSRCLAIDSARAIKVALALNESRARDGEQIRCLA